MSPKVKWWIKEFKKRIMVLAVIHSVRTCLLERVESQTVEWSGSKNDKMIRWVTEPAKKGQGWHEKRTKARKEMNKCNKIWSGLQCVFSCLYLSLRHKGLWNRHRQPNLFLTLSKKPERDLLWSKRPTSFTQSAAFRHDVDRVPCWNRIIVTSIAQQNPVQPTKVDHVQWS